MDGMASTGKKKTTMAKLQRESRLRERRQEKAARKRARKEDAAAQPGSESDAVPYDAADDPSADHGARVVETDHTGLRVRSSD
jgi:hypothetical protein